MIGRLYFEEDNRASFTLSSTVFLANCRENCTKKNTAVKYNYEAIIGMKQSLRNTTLGPLANQTYTSDTDGEARSFYVSRTIHVANFCPYAVPCDNC